MYIPCIFYPFSNISFALNLDTSNDGKLQMDRFQLSTTGGEIALLWSRSWSPLRSCRESHRNLPKSNCSPALVIQSMAIRKTHLHRSCITHEEGSLGRDHPCSYDSTDSINSLLKERHRHPDQQENNIDLCEYILIYSKIIILAFVVIAFQEIEHLITHFKKRWGGSFHPTLPLLHAVTFWELLSFPLPAFQFWFPLCLLPGAHLGVLEWQLCGHQGNFLVVNQGWVA